MHQNKGFTLIELLVVVLIIGILSAVALPQYQKAVFKSRAMNLYAVFNKLEDAQKIFYLASGEYATTKEQLDVDFTSIPSIFDANRSAIWDSKNGVLFFEFSFARHNGEYVRVCAARHDYSTYKYAKQFCEEMGGIFHATTGTGPIDYYYLPNR